MGRSTLFVLMVVSILIAAAASSRSEPSEAADADLGMPTSGPATEPLGPNPPRDPFTPYDPGPLDAVWPYEALSLAEKELIDRGKDTASWRGVHDVYAGALNENFAQAVARMAQTRLGLDHLDVTGVVP